MSRDIYDAWCTSEREREQGRARETGTAEPRYRCGCESTWAHYRFTEPSRAEPRANIVFTRTHGFAVQIIWYYCTYSTYARAKLFANCHSPAVSASLLQRSSRRISISVRANVNAAYCIVVPLKSHARRCNDYYSVSCVLYHRTYICSMYLSMYTVL